MNRLIPILFLPLLLMACGIQTVQTPTLSSSITSSSQPIVSTPKAKPSSSPTPTLRVWPTPKIITTPSPENNLTLPTFTTGQLYFDNRLLVDLNWYPLCFSLEISYSPTSEYFLVTTQCLEGQNDAYLFNSNTGGGRRITGNWEILHEADYSWAPNGQSLVYFRSYCCSDIPPELPLGLVLYNIPTGNRLFLLPVYPWPAQHHTLPERSSDGQLLSQVLKWSPNGYWLAYLLDCKIFLASSDGYNLWKIDTISTSTCATDGALMWENTDSLESLRLKYISSNTSENRVYIINQLTDKSLTESAILANLDSVMNP